MRGLEEQVGVGGLMAEPPHSMEQWRLSPLPGSTRLYHCKCSASQIKSPSEKAGDACTFRQRRFSKSIGEGEKRS
ncbi:hypothetical protein Y1Q_0017587 [Alligator mississippiensis]|uniref:Uncharacterized protein n=1 Tax=Alligator mississippiensis TaxID=8496 RepID=A0A151P2K1_ALLMI|nr:hypothetical protein Y1Q_0017587 [Alligator mississippiensis]